MKNMKQVAAIAACQSVGISFRGADGRMSKTYTFVSGIQVATGQWVIVDTSAGFSFGLVENVRDLEVERVTENSKFVMAVVDMGEVISRKQAVEDLSDQISRARSNLARKEALAEMKEMFGKEFVEKANSTAMFIAGVKPGPKQETVTSGN